MFLFSAVLTQKFCWQVCKLLTFLNSIFPRILFLFLIITSTFIIREWENFSFSGCPCPPCPCPPDRIEEEGGREKYLQNKFSFEEVGWCVSQKWNLYFDPLETFNYPTHLLQESAKGVYSYKDVVSSDSPVDSFFHPHCSATKSPGGERLWWLGILVGGQTKQTNALFGNGWPFPNNTRGKQERLHHLPLAGHGGNFDRQPARGSVEDGLLQFALTQFRPVYLVIKSGNFGRFIER